jgi:ABC-type multidrug transport system fused ATPase/permease subunit
MVELSEGAIIIDGVDIATIALHKLRYVCNVYVSCVVGQWPAGLLI